MGPALFARDDSIASKYPVFKDLRQALRAPLHPAMTTDGCARPAFR
jgi:hypothetical protein